MEVLAAVVTLPASLGLALLLQFGLLKLILWAIRSRNAKSGLSVADQGPVSLAGSN